MLIPALSCCTKERVMAGAPKGLMGCDAALTAADSTLERRRSGST